MSVKVIVEADDVQHGKFRAVARTNENEQVDEIIIERSGRDSLGNERWEHQRTLKWSGQQDDPFSRTMFALLSQVAKEKR